MNFVGQMAAVLRQMSSDRIDGPLANLSAVEIDAAHPRVGREGNERGVKLVYVASPQAVFFLGQDDDAAAFRRFVGQRGKLGRVGQPRRLSRRRRNEFNSLAIAERDGAGLVEQQRVDVAGCFDCAA